jgi:tetratricopeptide (TPR) repeat protein
MICRMSLRDQNLRLAVVNSLCMEHIVSWPSWSDRPGREDLSDLLDGFAAELSRLTVFAWPDLNSIRLRCDTYDDPRAFDLVSLEGIEACTGLRSFTVERAFAVADLEPLTRLRELTAVSLEYAPRVTDWTPLLRMPALREVTAPVNAVTAAALTERGVTVHHPAWLAPLSSHSGWPSDPAVVRQLLALAPTDGVHDARPFPDPNLGLAVLSCLVAEGRVPRQKRSALLDKADDASNTHDNDSESESEDADFDEEEEEEQDEDEGEEEDEDEDDDYELKTEVRDALLDVLAERAGAIAELTELSWGGGDDLQHLCYNYWDGEDDTFTVTSLAGLEQCLNLQVIDHVDLFSVSDLTPLTGLTRLESLVLKNVAAGTDWSPLLRIRSLRRVVGPVDAVTAEQLRERGVFVRSPHSPHPLETLCPQYSMTSTVNTLLELPADERAAWVRAHAEDPRPRTMSAAWDAVVALAWRMLEEPGDAAATAYAEALLHVGTLLQHARETSDAMISARNAVALFRSLGDAHRRRLAEALAVVATMADYDERFTTLTEALAILRDLDGATPAVLDLSARHVKAAYHDRRIPALRAHAELLREILPADPDRHGELLRTLTDLVDEFKYTDRFKHGIDDEVQLLAVLREPASATEPVTLAAALTQHGRRLTEAGRHDEAATARQEAAALYEGLAGHAEEHFKVVHNLSENYCRLGRTADALAAARRGLELARRLTEGYALSWALEDLQGRLVDAELHEEALAVAEEDVARRRGEASDGPDTGLARALARLTDSLHALCRDEEAADASAESLAILRAAAETDKWQREALAGALNNHANRLQDVRRHVAALAATTEAVERFRNLDTSISTNRDRNLGIVLGTHASALGRLGRHDEAVTAMVEAVDTARRLHADDTDGAAEYLASCLHKLAYHLNDAGRCSDAVERAAESVRIRRERAAGGDSDRLAMTLNSLAVALSGAGRHAEALAASVEAVELYRGAGDVAGLADALTDRATIHSRLGQAAEAAAASAEAVPLFRQAAATAPHRHTTTLAWALTVFAEVRPAGPEATAAADEAIGLYERHVANAPEVYTEPLHRAQQVRDRAVSP